MIDYPHLIDRGTKNPKPIYLSEAAIMRFWKRVEPMMDDRGCWEWTGRLINPGKNHRYGILYNGTSASNQNLVLAHRFSWALAHGDPGELWVLHKCDNPPCVNPSHLFVGTQKDNMADASRKGRLPRQLVDTCKYGHTKHWTTLKSGPRKGMTVSVCCLCNRLTQQRYAERKKAANT